MAGYMTTELYSTLGGYLSILAVASSPDNFKIVSVELYYGQEATGLMLPIADPVNNVFIWEGIYVGPGAPPGRYPVEMMATDQYDNQSALWPYLNVGE